MNERLFAARLKKGWSQEEAAAAAQVSVRTYQRWEHGERFPNFASRRLLRAAFEATDEELGFHFLKQAIQDKLPTPALHEPTTVYNISTLHLLATIPSTELDTLDIIRSRRQILHSLLSTAGAMLTLSPYSLLQSENQERLEQALLSPSQVSKDVLDDLSSITTSYWRLCANTSIDLLSGLMGHFTTIIDMLKWPHPTAIYLRLCSLAGENAQILGKTLYDMREYNLAWMCYIFSVKAAKEAKNDNLWATGLGRMALLLIYCGQPQNALPLLQNAQQARLHNARICAWLAAIEAEIYATLANHNGCTHAIDTSKHIAHTSPLEADTYTTGFDISRQVGYEGACFVRLHQPERAIPALQKALDTTSPTAIRRCATLYTDMSRAYAQLGDVEKACSFAQQALDITARIKSLSTLQRLYDVKGELKPWKNNTEVKNLNEQFAGTLATIITTKETP